MRDIRVELSFLIIGVGIEVVCLILSVVIDDMPTWGATGGLGIGGLLILIGIIGVARAYWSVVTSSLRRLTLHSPISLTPPVIEAEDNKDVREKQVPLALRLGEYEWRKPNEPDFLNIVKPNLHILVRFDITEPIEIDDIRLFVADQVKTPVTKSFSLEVSDSRWLKFVMSPEMKETIHTCSMSVHANGQWVDDSQSGYLMYPTL